ncbi:MAG: hypothetical protein K2Y23_26710 [Cyanobacteria bacterium]|nr:hypothetical protein [Cyanobacteriota bacterium]
MAKNSGWQWPSLPVDPLPNWLIVAIGAVLVVVDYATGPFFQFPSAYILVVVLAAWFNGYATGLTLAVLLPFTRVVLMEFYWHQPWDPIFYTATALTRAVVWSLLAFMAARLAEHERNLRKEVNVLITLLPVCAECHKIRGAGDAWESLEVYAKQHGSQLSPGLCPACLRLRLPEHVAPD